VKGGAVTDTWNVVKGERDLPSRNLPLRFYDKGARRCTEGIREHVREALEAWNRGCEGWGDLLAGVLGDLRSCSCNLEVRVSIGRNPARGHMEQSAEFRLSDRVEP